MGSFLNIHVWKDIKLDKPIVHVNGIVSRNMNTVLKYDQNLY